MATNKQAKPILVVSKSRFVDFMCDADGVNMNAIKKALKKNNNFNLDDLVKNCGYIPSRIIKNKKDIPKELKERDYNDKSKGFEVYPENFTVELV